MAWDDAWLLMAHSTQNAGMDLFMMAYMGLIGHYFGYQSNSGNTHRIGSGLE